MSQELGDEAQAAQALLGLAVGLSELGDKRLAARVWGAADMVLRRGGVAGAPTLTLPAMAKMRAIIEDSAYADDIEAGHALSIDEAVALAFGENATSSVI